MANPRAQGRTSWSLVKKKTDAEIRRAVKDDRDAAPIATAEWLRQARILQPKPKSAVSIRLDEDV